MEAALAALHEHFGFEDFREGQREVIASILEGRDTVVVMPTGGGKSVCYQLPAMMLEGATVVVSPLIALMKDQVDALAARDLPATFINSSIDFDEQTARIRGVGQGRYKLVYVAPERFRSERFIEALQQARISLFAIDEAHCISQWGHDFRPDYLRLRASIERIGRPQVVALTATATPHVRADIIEQLHLREPRAFVSGFDRPNLTIKVIQTQKEREKIAYVKQLASAYAQGSGIIYTSTRKAVEQVFARLRSAGLSVVAYHAGMTEIERSNAQDEFMSGRAQMIVATNAFGMGIDKPDIRFVAHYQLPGSIEAYYQEIGRAGRDGLPSVCALLFNYADKRTQDYFIEGSYPPPDVIARVYEALVGTGMSRIELSTKEIAARAGIRNEMAVQSALIILEKAGHIERGTANENRASVRLLVSPQVAREAVATKRSARDKQALFGLLGGYEVNERTEKELDTAEFAAAVGLDLASARRALSSLTSAGLISYTPARRTRGVHLLDERPAQQLRIRPQELARRAALEQRKLREMISFCYADRCYRAFILDYFGDRSHSANCGTCGNCAGEAQRERAPEGKGDDLIFSTVDGGRAQNARASSIPVEPATELDRFVMKHAPVALDLEEELSAQTRQRRAREAAEANAQAKDSAARSGAWGEGNADWGDSQEIIGGEDTSAGISVTQARELTADEALRARKILACAARMGGRFGKGLLAACLRGSRSAKIAQAGLDQLSTYGLLNDMTQDELVLYIDALVAAGCLHVTGGAYPTISLTALGGEVMRERATVRLALAEAETRSLSPAQASASTETLSRSAANGAAAKRASTVDETYELYCSGLSIEEIGERRGLTEITIEKHLADCITEGRPFDISCYVPAADRELIEVAVDQLGTERLKPLRDALPAHITYRMIRFVIADLQREEQSFATEEVPQSFSSQ